MPNSTTMCRLLAELTPANCIWLRATALARRSELQAELTWVEALCAALEQETASDCTPNHTTSTVGEGAAEREDTRPHRSDPSGQLLPGEAEVLAATVTLFRDERITTDDLALTTADVADRIAEGLGQEGGAGASKKYLERVGGALSREARRANPQIVNVGTKTLAKYRLPADEWTGNSAGNGERQHGR